MPESSAAFNYVTFLLHPRTLLSMPLAVVEGIKMCVKPPRSLKLEVDADFEERARVEREERRARHVPLSPLNLPTHKYPPTKWIHLFVRGKSHDGKERREECSIAIDLSKRRIDDTRTTRKLFGGDDDASGDAGLAIALISAPVLFVLSPLIKVARDHYEKREREHEMSCYGIEWLKALKGQLDPETEILLIEALKNTWKHDQYMARTPSVQEAKEFLRQCELVVYTLTPRNESEEGYKRWLWFDQNGDPVGSYENHIEFGAVPLKVLGSEFSDEDESDPSWRELLDCYRTRTERAEGDETSDD